MKMQNAPIIIQLRMMGYQKIGGGKWYFAIHHMAESCLNGLKNATMKASEL
jgi:hypothetical protein